MKLVLRALLGARAPRPADRHAELPRRRNITIRPGESARVALPQRVREPALVT